MRNSCSFVVLASLLAAAPAISSPLIQIDDLKRSSSQVTIQLPEIQLAQGYDFQVYIDKQGREVIVDPRTGHVVEIREPFRDFQPQRRNSRSGYPQRPYEQPQQDYGGRYYDFSDPRDLERFHREREAAISGDYYEPVPPYEDSLGNYPDLPSHNNAGAWDYGSGRDIYPGEQDVFRGEQHESRQVTRQPLAAPSPNHQDRENENWQNDSRPDNRFTSAPDHEVNEQSSSSASLEPLSPEITRPNINPNIEITVPGANQPREDVAKFQILLDRAGASPGVIDGRMGDNVNKAISSYYEITGQRMRTYDKEWIEAELASTGGDAFIDYMITSEDVAGQFIASVPSDYSEKAKLDKLSYISVSEMLAERFHMDEKYLVALNPGINFNRPGSILKVANSNIQLNYEVSRIVADKNKKQLRIYNSRNQLVAAYPATIGSENTPSPSGTHQVERIALNPEYTYNPKINFTQGNNTKVLTIPPGPNGPVGTVWIGLSKPTYGIHGTPDPDKIGKTFSNGCVRLTNWDAEELARRVKPGVNVEFL